MEDVFQKSHLPTSKKIGTFHKVPFFLRDVRFFILSKYRMIHPFTSHFPKACNRVSTSTSVICMFQESFLIKWNDLIMFRKTGIQRQKQE